MGGEPRLEEVVDQCAGRIGVMCELKSPWRYRRHDVVARTVRLLPEDAVVVCFEPGALRQVRNAADTAARRTRRLDPASRALRMGDRASATGV